MERPTLAQHKLLRTLSKRAHELELARLLKGLRGAFDDWEEGKLSPWELSDRIQEFQDGSAQDVHRFYETGTDYTFHVAHAIKEGLLSLEEIPESCRDRVQFVIDTFSDS